MRATTAEIATIAAGPWRLRPLVCADAAAIAAACSDFAVTRWLARVPHPYPAGEAERFIAAVQRDGARVWAIEASAAPGLIGVLELRGDAARGHLAYWLAQPAWGRGIGSRAARAAVDWAFGKAGLDRLTSGAFEGNAASLRIQEKLGFRVVGTHPVACRAQRRSLPHVNTELTRARWEAMR